MGDDKFGDWRHWAATTLAKDLTAAFPGGPSHKAGTPVYQAAATLDNKGQTIAFTMPYPTALALSVAIQAAKKADILREEITFEPQVSPHPKAKGVPSEQAPRLYDFFEQCMIAVTFSFNALEIYCNQIVADEMKSPYQRPTGKKAKNLSSDEVQRSLSTEEKLTEVLPTILGVKSPKTVSVWSDFQRLKRARHSTIHMKSHEAYTRGDIQRKSLFDDFFTMPSLMGFPIFAVELIRHFYTSNREEPRWLRRATELAHSLNSARRPGS